MTRFLDVRVNSGGPPLAKTVAINQWTGQAYQSMPLGDLQNDIRGKNVLIGTHGFNVNRQDGIACLSSWESLLQLGANDIFVGLLWPGDSVWLHALSYPEEPRIANDAGQLFGPWIEQNFSDAASISFASHSLGARVVLKAISAMTRRVRRCTLMAGAIDDNCLNTEFQNTAANIDAISALASKGDAVLADAFPIGNILGGIIAAGHPWFHTALGRDGPSKPWPANFQAPFQIPDDWGYGHHNYLEVDSTHPAIGVPQDVPPQGAAKPATGATGWTETWSAAFASTRFR
jgi:alpha/beta hydrolase family protein DUF900